MKTKNLLKKAFLLLALMGGASSAWADDVYECYYNGTKVVNTSNYFSSDNTLMGSGYNNNMTITFTNNNGDEITSSKFTKLTNAKGVNFTVTEDHTASVSVVAVTKDKDSGNGIKLKKQNGDTWDDVASYTAAPSTTYTSYETSFSNLTAGTYRMERNSQENAAVYVKVVEVSTVEATSEVLKSSAAVKVGESTLTKDAATNGYSVDGTTITLSNDISAIAAPTNVALVKTITYDDESTKDEDVDVTFDGTITEGYYIGTASIGLTGSVTNYTVKVKKSVVPTATLSETSGTISMPNSYTVIGSTTVTLTGGNLTDGEYTVTADKAGTTISPSSFTVADGSVDQEFTITTSGSSAATTVFTFGTSGMGVAAPTYTLTYEQVAKRSLSQTDVSTATTWDWANAGSNSIQLTTETNPTRSEEFLLSDLQEIPNSGDFNSQALKVICEWPNRENNSYIQVNSIKFNATVHGTVQVWFSNTGSRTDEPAQRRYLYVNNTNSDVYSLNTTMTNTAPMPVSAGEVVINAKTGTGDPTMVRINKIIFTPVSSVSATIGSTGWTTFASPYALNLSSMTASEGEVAAYYASNVGVDNVTMTSTESSAVAAGTGLMLKGTAGATITIPVAASAGTAISGNRLVGCTTSTPLSVNENYYVLVNNGGTAEFQRLDTNGATIPAGKAYLNTTASNSARSLRISFGNITNVANVEAAAEAKAQDGKFIENGKIVIVKNGKKFNANGQQVK